MSNLKEISLDKINALLSKIKIPICLLSLKECVPSLWIALFEGLLETRIAEIDRSFALSDDARFKNLQVIITKISKLFTMDLDHIKPLDLISYNEEAICSFIDVFVRISESLNGENNISTLSNSDNEPGDLQKKRKRSIYTGNKLRNVVQDDISKFVKEYHRSSLEEIQTSTPIKAQAAELLKFENTDTPHMKALKLKRRNLLQNISQATETVTKTYKSQRNKESNISKLIEKEIKQISSRPKKGPLSQIDQVVIGATSKEVRTRPEKNLDRFEERVRRSMPLCEPFPSEKVKDHMHEQQIKTWTKALDDRLWNKKVSSSLQGVPDTRIIEQAKKEIEKTRDIEQRKKESNALKSIKAELNERVRRAVRMEHRLQVAHEDVEKIKLKRSFREEQAVKGLLDDYVKTERRMIIEERRFEKDKKKEKEAKSRQRQEAKLNYYRDQIELLKEQYEETKREERIMEKAQKEEHRRIIRDKKDAAKNKVKMVKEKLEVDASNLGFQEATAQRLRSSLKFAFR